MYFRISVFGGLVAHYHLGWAREVAGKSIFVGWTREAWIRKAPAQSWIFRLSFLFYVLVVFSTLLNIFPQESWLIIVIIYDHLLVGHLKANGVVFRMHASIKLSSMEMYPPLISYVIYMLCEFV